MQTKTVSLMTLMLMISFASVNAVLFTPALPDIANYFDVSNAITQNTITWFLVGYTLGQLFYGPIANRYGRKPALYLGIGLQIISCLLCILSGMFHEFILLITGRFLLALGSGVGLKMAFTLVNETYSPEIASQKISYLMISFAIAPALGIALGGILNSHFGWISCFYASAFYGVILLFLSMRLSETCHRINPTALYWRSLVENYMSQLRNKKLVLGSLLMGGCTAFIYIFAALAPFIAIDLLDMPSVNYGLASLLPPIGLIFGSLYSAKISKYLSAILIIYRGLFLSFIGVFLMTLAFIAKLSAIVSLFLPLIIIYFGLALIMPAASSIAMSSLGDKSHGSAMMSFINMASATLCVLSLGLFSIHSMMLPFIYITLSLFMAGILRYSANLMAM